MTATQLHLIRHAEGVTNVEPIIGGMRGDTGLTPRGVVQAERLRDRLAATGEITADVLISSTLARARQTAEIIAPALGLPIILDDEMQELRPGQSDAMTVDEARATFGIPDFNTEPLRPLAPGGESWGSFMLRACSALDRVSRDNSGRTVVIVCHGGIVEASFTLFFGLSALRVPPVHLGTHNTAITQWEQRTGDARWRLLRYNDDTHVRDMERLQPRGWADA